MSQQLRVLMLDGSEVNAALVIRELQRSGYDVLMQIVDAREPFVAALDTGAWDMVFAEAALPGYGVREALDEVTSRGRDIPFIVLSDTVDEGRAVALMRAGAHDYLLRSALTRLVPAVERELREKRLRAAHAASEARVRDSERTLAGFFRSSPLLLAITRLHDGRIIEVNDQMVQAFGWRREELLGRSTTDLGMYPDPALRERVVDVMAREGAVRGIEVEFRSREGETMNGLFSAERVEIGGEACMVSAVLDITAHKRAEGDLQASRGQYRALLALSPDAIVACDGAGRVREISERTLWMFGYARREDVIGRAALDFIAPVDRARAAANIAALAGDGGPRVDEYRLLRADGGELVGETHASILRDGDGRPAGFLGLIRDVTKARAVAADLAAVRAELAAARAELDAARSGG